jgi:hypothetical protein
MAASAIGRRSAAVAIIVVMAVWRSAGSAWKMPSKKGETTGSRSNHSKAKSVGAEVLVAATTGAAHVRVGRAGARVVAGGERDGTAYVESSTEEAEDERVGERVREAAGMATRGSGIAPRRCLPVSLAIMPTMPKTATVQAVPGRLSIFEDGGVWCVCVCVCVCVKERERRA